MGLLLGNSLAISRIGGALGAAPWTPSDITTAAWYDASDSATITESGGAVSQWNDKSGNGNHAVQDNGTRQPVTNSQTIGGLNAVDFLGGDWLSASGASLNMLPTGGCNVFAVTRTTGGVVCYSGNSTQVRTYGFKNLVSYGSGSTTVATSTTDIGGVSSLLTGIGTESPNTTLIRVNGTQEDTQAVYDDFGGAETFTLGTDEAGTSTTQITRSMIGQIGELVLVSGVISDSDRDLVEGYLAHKWGLEANLPGGHPYKTNAPTA